MKTILIQYITDFLASPAKIQISPNIQNEIVSPPSIKFPSDTKFVQPKLYSTKLDLDIHNKTIKRINIPIFKISTFVKKHSSSRSPCRRHDKVTKMYLII